MRPYLLLVLFLIVGCSSTSQRQVNYVPKFPVVPPSININLADYSRPFGDAPEKLDFTAAFLSLPDALAADMSLEMRKMYIEEYETKSMGYMFDSKHRYAIYYNDNAYNPIQPSSIFRLKILPSTKYHYIFLIHMDKPPCLETPPSGSNTFFLAPSNSKWIDITNRVLPRPVFRDWYFQPARGNGVVETGPYEQSSNGHWGAARRVYDLVWDNDHFKMRRPSSSKFSDDWK